MEEGAVPLVSETCPLLTFSPVGCHTAATIDSAKHGMAPSKALASAASRGIAVTLGAAIVTAGTVAVAGAGALGYW